jgi:hypothetical protein
MTDETNDMIYSSPLLCLTWPEYLCPKHGNIGNIGNMTVQFHFGGKASRQYCGQCLLELLDPLLPEITVIEQEEK